MTTRSENGALVEILGDVNSFPMVASDILYTRSAIGLVDASGHARPLTSSDKFGGFCRKKADNSTGAAAAINVDGVKKGTLKLSISGAVITDVDNPVYATDDDTFVFSPVGAVYIGIMTRFISAGVGEVTFHALVDKDPYLKYGSPEEYETKSANYTLDILDNGKVIFIDTDAFTITLPVVATPVNCTIVNIGAYGTILVKVAPNSADMIHAPDIAGTNNKAHQNTKATARRGDLVQLRTGDADGWIVSNQKGIWAQES